MSDWYINGFELGYANGIYLDKAPQMNPDHRYEIQSAWLGTRVKTTNIQAQATTFNFSGWADTEAHFQPLMKYTAHNYNWNLDLDDLYLIKDLNRRWKIKSMKISPVFDPYDYSFSIDMVVDKPSAEGMVSKEVSGTFSTSPESLAAMTNPGDLNTGFEEIVITGIYSGANLTSPRLYHSTTGAYLAVAGVIFDGAVFTFYPDFKAFYTYADTFVSADKFVRNKNASSCVTFSTDRLLFANSSSLTFYHSLTHPLSNDPVVTLTVPVMVGDPIIEVSPDGNNWWTIEKTIDIGVGIPYALTKMAGYSSFYWRIVCDSNDTMQLTKMIFESWHTYEDCYPPVEVQAGAIADLCNISFSAGSGTYSLKWRDLYSI